MKAGHVPQTKLHQKLIQATQVIIALVKERKQFSQHTNTHTSTTTPPLHHSQAAHEQQSSKQAMMDSERIPLATPVTQRASSHSFHPLSASPQSPPPVVTVQGPPPVVTTRDPPPVMTQGPPPAVTAQTLLNMESPPAMAVQRLATGMAKKSTEQEIASSDAPHEAPGPTASHQHHLPGKIHQTILFGM